MNANEIRNIVKATDSFFTTESQAGGTYAAGMLSDAWHIREAGPARVTVSLSEGDAEGAIFAPALQELAATFAEMPADGWMLMNMPFGDLQAVLVGLDATGLMEECKAGAEFNNSDPAMTRVSLALRKA